MLLHVDCKSPVSPYRADARFLPESADFIGICSLTHVIMLPVASPVFVHILSTMSGTKGTKVTSGTDSLPKISTFSI